MTRSAVLHDTMGYRIFLFSYKKNAVVWEKSRQGSAKARPVWIFLYSENFFPQAALAPPNEKNQNVLSALTNHHCHVLACYFVLQSNAYQKECVSILKIHITVIARQAERTSPAFLPSRLELLLPLSVSGRRPRLHTSLVSPH